MNEFEEKQLVINEFMAVHKIDALVLHTVSSFSWATCGAASYINIASTTGEASLVITSEKKFLVTNNIERPRMSVEEKLENQGWEIIETLWYQQNDVIADLTRGLKTGTDISGTRYKDLSEALARTRAVLTPSAGEHFRVLGRQCAQAMNAAAHSVRPGMTEFEIAGMMAHELEKRGVQMTVNLVGTDERIFAYRHPLPTAKKLQRYAMLIFCGRWKGLVCSITRLVHFGAVPEEVRQKANATAHIDAHFIEQTRPGKRVGEIFQHAVNEYAAMGFPDEWKKHHQGGPVGYEPREYLARPDSTEEVTLGQVYAWNPSITGVKSEDTILISEENNEILTEIEGWPTIATKVNGRSYQRPDILEVT
ncbi:MAG: M24 family metallopeptidase [Anaerolineales bacterium]|nr:M24 family metallopeptidase [Anaerolineales bacterium]